MNLVLKQIQKDMDDFFADMDKAIGKKPKPIKLWPNSNDLQIKNIEHFTLL